MLEGLREVSSDAVPFARTFYGQASQNLWESDSGEIHSIPQGEGGEQGDAMMPLLYSLGQHGALQDVSRRLGRGEHLWVLGECTVEIGWNPNPCGQNSNLEPGGDQT